jgi:MFS family permease
MRSGLLSVSDFLHDPTQHMKIVVLSVAAMLVQQAFATMAPMAIPLLGPVVVKIFGLNPGYIGGLAALTYGIGMLSAVASGSVIRKYGPLRVGQLSLLLCGVGLWIGAAGSIPFIFVGVLLIGIGIGPSTPASSHILVRFAPPHLAPLIFSIKQTGVPLGGIMAGTLFPYWLDLVDWQGALLIAGSLYLAFALIIQPLRPALDDERDPTRRFSVSAMVETFRFVLGNPVLRELALAHCIFTGLQVTFGTFFVVFLLDGLGFDLVFAGLAFAFGQGAGFVGRILWGWVASRFLPTRLVLGLLGVAMAVSGAALALIDGDWTKGAVIALSAAYGLTGIGFQGVMLAEVARNAPPGGAGDVTGVAVVFAYAGMVIFPGLIGIIVGLTGSYEAGFILVGLITLPVGTRFLRPARAVVTRSPPA